MEAWAWLWAAVLIVNWHRKSEIMMGNTVPSRCSKTVEESYLRVTMSSHQLASHILHESWYAFLLCLQAILCGVAIIPAFEFLLQLLLWLLFNNGLWLQLQIQINPLLSKVAFGQHRNRTRIPSGFYISILPYSCYHIYTYTSHVLENPTHILVCIFNNLCTNCST